MIEKVSVVVPVYNAAENIKNCILSILNQSYKNIEVIAVDDGSTDASYSILQELEYKDSRLKVITQENMGVSSARNNGIEFCTGEFLQFVDSDDYIDERYIEQLIEAIQCYDIVISSYKIVAHSKIRNSELYVKKYETKDAFIEDLHKVYAAKLLNSPCNKLFKMSFIRESGLKFDASINMGEDLLFVLSYLEQAIKINCVCLDNVYNYVVVANENSLTKTFDIEYLNMYKFINSSLKVFVEKNGFLNFEQCYSFNSGYTNSVINFIINYLVKEKLNNSVYTKIYHEINFEYINMFSLNKKNRIVIKCFMSQNKLSLYLLKGLLKIYRSLK